LQNEHILTTVITHFVDHLEIIRFHKCILKRQEDRNLSNQIKSKSATKTKKKERRKKKKNENRFGLEIRALVEEDFRQMNGWINWQRDHFIKHFNLLQFFPEHSFAFVWWAAFDCLGNGCQ
jgi:hypothetical protein